MYVLFFPRLYYIVSVQQNGSVVRENIYNYEEYEKTKQEPKLRVIYI